MSHIMTSLSFLSTIIYTILISDTVTENMALLLTNTTAGKNETEHEVPNIELLNYTLLKWQNYLWLIMGFLIGVLLMLIVNSKLCCKVLCSNSHILNRIRTFFRILWHEFRTWFRHYCLRRPRGEYFFSTPGEDNNVVASQDNRINTYEMPQIPRIPQLQPQSPQQSQLPFPQMSQLPRGSLLLQLTNQSETPSQRSQLNTRLSTVSRQQHIPQQSLPVSISNPVSQQLPVNPVTISPKTAVVCTTVITPMIATSTTNTAISHPVTPPKDYM